MKTTPKVLIGGNDSTFQYLSHQLSLNGYSTTCVTANPLDIQFEALTSKPSAVFLSSSAEHPITLIDNLKKIDIPPAVYVIQSQYDLAKNKKIEEKADGYFLQPINITQICSVMESHMRGRNNITMTPTLYKNKLHNYISEILSTFCITPNYNGYMYIREAIKMAALEPINSRGFSTRIYPRIAKEFNVSPASIERNIRTVISKGWERASSTVKTGIFGVVASNPEWKPTNGEYILVVADKIHREYMPQLKAAE